ncbi:hypothetical protein [Intrasporangium sp. DVR]|uniref:hypothetical protein n=1 Tax=Intrasporangium sp. DVR TaxID=3127867 RepID=UPI00313A5324
MSDPSTLYEVYVIVRAAYRGGRAAYRFADKKVAEYAEREGITKEEAWRRVRAEAVRRGDRGVEQMADLIIRAGPLSAALLGPGAPVLAVAFKYWRRGR